tara:strand:+ start:8277 stop:8609 length:333 start_codon:yes stop_codon:yes gene_type:complete
MQPSDSPAGSKSDEQSDGKINVYLQLLNKEDTYNSSRAINSLQSSQINRLQKQLEQIEKTVDLSDQMRREATEIRLGLGLLQDQVDEQKEQLKGVKSVLKKLWDFFRPPS